MVGVGLEDTGVVAVRIGDGGVEARAAARADGDLAGAAARAIDEVGGGSAGPVGVASAVPEAAPIAAATAALAERYRGAIAQHATPAGVAVAVAEAWRGAAKGVSDVVLFSVGSHAIGGVVRAGVPISGARGRAGSVGWVSLNPVEREDYRKVGCVEAEVAAAGIVRRMIWRIKAGDRSRVQDMVHDDFSTITVDHILEAARGNDGVSISVMRDTAKYLGMAAANLVAIADPEMLVLGGIMASASDLLLDPIRAELSRRLPRTMIEGLAIVTAALGDDAAAIGAARLAGAARP